MDAADLGAQLLKASMPAFAAALEFKIDDAETGDLIPFDINDPQGIVYREIRRQEVIGRPVRILILKGRQRRSKACRRSARRS